MRVRLDVVWVPGFFNLASAALSGLAFLRRPLSLQHVIKATTRFKRQIRRFAVDLSVREQSRRRLTSSCLGGVSNASDLR